MENKATLAQKYRPLTFKDVLDQEGIIKVLKSILKNKKYSSPFMFVGIFGGGKTTLARILSRAILCKNLGEDFEPCNECSSCNSFLAGNNIAYTEIDAASHSGVDAIRKIKDDANYKVLGDYERKVIVIDESHSISKQGNEALLKQLEDNSDSQVYIFCTTAPESMNDAVRSRCFEFSLNKNTEESIFNRLKDICDKEKIIFEEAALKTIASVTSPHVRDSIKTLEYLSNFGEVSNKIVGDHFKLHLNIEYLKLLVSLKDNVQESIKVLKEISTRTSVQKIYEGLIENSLKTLKYDLGLNLFKNIDEERKSQEISNLYGKYLHIVLEYLLKRNKYADILTLESDILLLNKKLNGNYAEIPQEILETPSKASVPSFENKTKEKTLESKDSFEDTEKVLKRYKAFPPALAMMMDRSKKSSLKKENKTVELNKEVKEYKPNLSKTDIKYFLDSKLKGT